MIVAVALLCFQANAQNNKQASIDRLNKKSWDIHRKDPSKALELAREALLQAQQINYATGEAYAHKNLGVLDWMKGDFNLAANHYNRALKLFIYTHNDQETGHMYNLFGLNYAETGNYKNAVRVYNKAVEIYRRIHDTESEANTLTNLGIIHYNIGNYTVALESYFKGLKIYEKARDRHALSNTYNNIGLIYSEQKRYNKARNYYHKSLRIDESLDDVKGVAAAWNNLGTSYFHEQKYDSSLLCHRNALACAQKIGDKKIISHSFINMGGIYTNKKLFVQADSCLNLALELKRQISDMQGEALVWLNFGRLQLAQQETVKALESFKASYALAQKTGSVKIIRDASQALYEVYTIMGNKDEALVFYKNYQLYKDSLANATMQNKLYALEMAREGEKTRAEIALLHTEKTIERNRKITYAITAVLVLMAGALMVSRQRIKTSKEKQLRVSEKEKHRLQQENLRMEITQRETELAFNRQELMNYTRMLLEKNQLLEEITRNLEELDLSVNELKERNRVDKIEKLTEARILTDDDWNRFKKLFEKVFPGFFIKLKEAYPGITAAEIRLAALIKLKLNSREIATMTGVSAESVKKTRQRIRKKMGMEMEEDLEEVIGKL
ncbi:MAG TPA: tetratricopeptide repeat protein [Flavobacteriales bacterium]|nr:tetratricopeptide repeat protein [Flavobacteriales bacterium]